MPKHNWLTSIADSHTDSHFKLTRPIVGASVGRVKRGGCSAATGCSARLWWRFRARLTLHVFRHRARVILTVMALDEPSLGLLRDAAIEHALARTARPIPRRSAVRCPALGPHARTLCAALRRWVTGWRARCACRHGQQRLDRAAEGSWLDPRRRREPARRAHASRLVNGCLPENWDVRATVWNWPQAEIPPGRR
jgi:hypothetical protein